MKSLNLAILDTLGVVMTVFVAVLESGLSSMVPQMMPINDLMVEEDRNQFVPLIGQAQVRDR